MHAFHGRERKNEKKEHNHERKKKSREQIRTAVCTLLHVRLSICCSAAYGVRKRKKVEAQMSPPTSALTLASIIGNLSLFPSTPKFRFTLE